MPPRSDTRGLKAPSTASGCSSELAGAAGARGHVASGAVVREGAIALNTCDRNLRSLSKIPAELHNKVAPSALRSSNFVFFRFTYLHHLRVLPPCCYGATPREREIGRASANKNPITLLRASRRKTVSQSHGTKATRSLRQPGRQRTRETPRVPGGPFCCLRTIMPGTGFSPTPNWGAT